MLNRNWGRGILSMKQYFSNSNFLKIFNAIYPDTWIFLALIITSLQWGIVHIIVMLHVEKASNFYQQLRCALFFQDQVKENGGVKIETRTRSLLMN